MGIKFLNSFINSISDSRICYELHDTKLVIDANNLMLTLYFQYYNQQNDNLYGGNYTDYKIFFKQFFANLKKCKIIPIMIFDGGLNQRLLDNRFKRFKQVFENSKKISENDFSHNNVIFPPLLRATFDLVIRELNICSLKTRFDADLDSAKLANSLNCPLLSDDSDFLLLDLKFGVISIQFFQWESPKILENHKNIKTYFIECSFYQIDDFCSKFYGFKKELFPTFATLMGNDFIEAEMFSELFEKFSNNSGSDLVRKYEERTNFMKQLLIWLNKTFANERHAIDWIRKNLDNRRNNIELIEFSISQYKTGDNKTYLSQLFENYKILKSQNYNNLDLQDLDIFKPEPRLPNWFLIEFHCDSRLSSQFIDFIESKVYLLKPQIEKFSLPSVYECCEDLIGFISGLLRLKENDLNSLKLVSRKNDEIREKVIEPKIFLNKSIEKLPNLTEIEFISDEKRREIFFNLLNSSQEFINDLSETFKNKYFAIEEDINFWTYFIVVVNYWKSRTLWKKFTPMIYALVFSVVHFKYTEKFDYKEEEIEKVMKPEMDIKKRNRELVHYYCEFQTCVSYTQKLSSLLKHPLSRAQLHEYLNGVFVHKLYEKFANNDFTSFETKRLKSIYLIVLGIILKSDQYLVKK